MEQISTNSELTGNRVATGVQGFDSLVEGGFPRGDLILLAGHPGSGKTIFSAQYLYHGASQLGEPGIYVSFAENREAFLRNMKRTKMDFIKLEQQGRFKFIDLVTVKEAGVEDVLALILSEIDATRATRLVIDSFSALAQAFTERINARIVLHTILGKMTRLRGVTTILISEKPVGSELIGGGIEEFVSDGVVILSNSPARGYLRRKLQVIKMRGTRTRRTEVRYDIGDHGLILYPIPEINPVQKVYSERIKTGIEGLDRMLGGGPFKGSIMLVTGAPGSGKTTTGLHFIVEGARSNERGLFVSFEQSEEQLTRQGEAFGWKMKELLARGIMRIESYIPQPDNVEDIFLQIQRHMEERFPSRLVIDSVTALNDLVPEDTYVQWVKAGESALRALGVTSLLTETGESIGPVSNSEISSMADVILSLRHVESDSDLKRALVLFKACGINHDTSIREFEITPQGMAVKEKFAGLEHILRGSAKNSRDYVWQEAITKNNHELNH